MSLGRFSEGEAQLRASLDRARELGQSRLIGHVLHHIAHARSRAGDFRQSRSYHAEALEVQTAIKDPFEVALAAICLAEDEYRAGNVVTAVSLATDGLRGIRFRKGSAALVPALNNLAEYLVALDRYDEARPYAREMLEVARELEHTIGLVVSLQHLAAIEMLSLGAERRRNRWAARLFGFVEAYFRARGGFPSDAETLQVEFDRLRAALREAFDVSELTALMAAGAAMTEDEAVEEAGRLAERRDERDQIVVDVAPAR